MKAVWLTLLLFSTPQATEEQNDPLAARKPGAPAEIGPLAAISLCSNELGPSRDFYTRHFGLTATELDASVEQRRAWGELWGATPTRLVRLERPGVNGAVPLRLLEFPDSKTASRRSHAPLEPGPFSLGFPTEDFDAWDQALRAAGIAAKAPRQEARIPRPDGTSYRYFETIFAAPDFLHAVLISRLDGMSQVGPVDPLTWRGGPAYVSFTVVDSDALIAFLTEGLGLELRADRRWTTGPGSALGLAAGYEFRFSLLYAPGAETGHLLVLDFGERAEKATGTAPRPPHRGLCGLSFPVSALDTTLARLKKRGDTIVADAREVALPGLGPRRTATVLAPNGVMLELFEP